MVMIQLMDAFHLERSYLELKITTVRDDNEKKEHEEKRGEERAHSHSSTQSKVLIFVFCIHFHIFFNVTPEQTNT